MALAMAASTGQAADLGIMPAFAPAFGWSGLYVGANASLGLARIAGADFQGVMGGGHGGINFLVTGPLVLGIEGDVSASDLATTTTISILGVPTAIRSRTYGTATLRGRAGFAIERFMAYGTAGYGVAANTMSSTIAGVTATDARLHHGLAYGGGVEFRILPALSLRGEYLRAHYGSEDYFGGIPSGAIKTNTIRVGISYIR